MYFSGYVQISFKTKRHMMVLNIVMRSHSEFIKFLTSFSIAVSRPE